MVHDLQQQVEDLRMSFLDLVHQQHAVRVPGDGFGQQTALVEPHVAGRRADQPGHGVPLHIFGHVEAHQLHAHGQGQLPGDFGLAHAGRSVEQERTHGTHLVAEAGARHLDGGRQGADGGVLAEDDQLQVALQVAEDIPVGSRNALRRNSRHPGHDVLDAFDADDFLPFGFRHQANAGAGFVDHVDRLVGQMAVVDVPARQLRRGLERFVDILDVMMFLEPAAQTLQNLHGFLDGRFDDIDLLEAARKGAILLEDAAEFGVGG